MKKEEIAQWVISNRYPKSELDKVSDVEMYNFIVDKITELIGPEIDLDLLAVENEKKNARIRELEESLKDMVYATGSYVVGPCYDRLEKVEAKIYNKAKQLLNQKP